MKKHLSLLFASLFIIMCFGNYRLFFAFADEEHVPSYVYMTENDFINDFEPNTETTPGTSDFGMITYFKNLNTYSPVNSHGSCGYVSFIQYLSYYDTFRNDLIIPASYERNQGNTSDFSTALLISPGVLRQPYPSTNLYNHIQNNKSADFQMYLMDIVNSSYNRVYDAYRCDIGMWDYYRILNALYPNFAVQFNYTRVQNFGNTAKPTDVNVISWFDNYVKTQIDLGNPVMLHIAKYNIIDNKYESYHSVVAYYYDEAGIHAHFGWGNLSSDIVINSSYQITEAGVVNFGNIELAHSNNYLVNNIEYCGCGIQYHIHNFNCWEYYNHNLHKEKCSCGLLGVETNAHWIYETDVVNNKANCRGCHHLLDFGYDYAQVITLNYDKKLTINGSYTLPSGTMVIVESDILAFTNGTLIWYNENELPQVA